MPRDELLAHAQYRISEISVDKRMQLFILRHATSVTSEYSYVTSIVVIVRRLMPLSSGVELERSAPPVGRQSNNNRIQ